MTFTGCGTALVTPFHPDGTLDLLALRQLVEWQIGEGIDFLVPCGSTGEAQTLSRDERLQVVAAVIEVAAGRVPVLAGATHNDTAEAVREARAMCDLGADGILTATPYYNKPTAAGQLKHFTAVADASTKPVVLYNVPGRTAVDTKPAVVLELARHPNIAGIKEATGDLVRAVALLADRPEGFLILSGEDALTVGMVACGGDGVISVTSNEAPGPMATMTRAARTGDFATARRLLMQLFPLMEANFLETNPGPVKAALAMMGRIANVLRLPLVPVGDATTGRLGHALRLAGILENG